jgi:NitT/TauT family transport system permease protein
MRQLATTLVSLTAFLIAWKALTVVTGTPDYILPAPEVVGERAVRAIGSGLLWEHTAVTLTEILLGLGVGAATAIAVGTALGKSVVVERVLSPYIVAAQSVPILALAPLLDIWFGGGLLARVLICALIVFFPIAIATMVGIRSADPLLVEMFRSLGATPGQRTTRLEIPSALPVIFGGLRVGVTLAVIGAVVAEWAGASSGLGVLINIADQGLFDTPLMFVALATLAVIGIGLHGPPHPPADRPGPGRLPAGGDGVAIRCPAAGNPAARLPARCPVRAVLPGAAGGLFRRCGTGGHHRVQGWSGSDAPRR